MKELKASVMKEKADDVVIRPATGRDRGCGPGLCVGDLNRDPCLKPGTPNNC